MKNRLQKSPRVQSAQEQYPRKIGYVAYRLGDLKTTPTVKPAPRQTPRLISDWASI